jgi:hypothetical protein
MNTATASTVTVRPHRRKGRPTVFTAPTRKRLVKAIGAGVPMRMACAICRVSYSGFCDYRNANPKFEARIQKAVADAVEWHLSNILSAAKHGDVQSSRWFLERTQPGHFGRTKLEVTGADGESLPGTQVAVLVWPHQQSDSGISLATPAPLPAQDTNHADHPSQITSGAN